MNIVEKPISEITFYERNPRKNDAAVEAVAKSIQDFGFKQPIVIDAEGVIVAGHTRVKAAKKLKLKTVPCVLADDLTEEQIKAYRIADNSTAGIAEWDIEMLLAEVAELPDWDFAEFGLEDILPSPETYDDFTLPDGEKSPFETISFTLATEQADLIRYAMGIVKNDIHETFGNENSNGNAIYEVVRQWAEQRKSH